MKPIVRRWTSVAGDAVRGSISIENSPVRSDASVKYSRVAAISSVVSAFDRKVGVPPPQWSCVTVRSGSKSAACSAISCFNWSRYGRARLRLRVAILLQPQ